MITTDYIPLLALIKQKVSELDSAIVQIESRAVAQTTLARANYIAETKAKSCPPARWIRHLTTPRILPHFWGKMPEHLELKCLLESPDTEPEALSSLLNLHVLNTAIEITRTFGAYALEEDRIFGLAEELRQLSDILYTLVRGKSTAPRQ